MTLQVSVSVCKYVAWGFNFIFCSTQFNIKYIVCQRLVVTVCFPSSNLINAENCTVSITKEYTSIVSGSFHTSFFLSTILRHLAYFPWKTLKINVTGIFRLCFLSWFLQFHSISFSSSSIIFVIQTTYLATSVQSPGQLPHLQT